MTPKKQRRLAFAITLLLAGGGAAGLAVYALQDNILFFYSPTDVAEHPEKVPVGRTFRIGGLVQLQRFVAIERRAAVCQRRQHRRTWPIRVDRPFGHERRRAVPGRQPPDQWIQREHADELRAVRHQLQDRYDRDRPDQSARASTEPIDMNGLERPGQRDRKSTRLNSSHSQQSRMPSSA